MTLPSQSMMPMRLSSDASWSSTRLIASASPVRDSPLLSIFVLMFTRWMHFASGKNPIISRRCCSVCSTGLRPMASFVPRAMMTWAGSSATASRACGISSSTVAPNCARSVTS